MVPRPSGNGDRHGDYGIWRRRVHRVAALRLVDAAIFDAEHHVGVAQTFIGLGVIYLLFMMVGAVRSCAYRRQGWRPEGYTPPAVAQKLITDK